MNDEPGPVHLISADPSLGASVARLAAAAGARLETFPDVERLSAAWSGAVVLIGADLVADVASVAPPRRDKVLVVNDGRVPLSLEAVLRSGAEAVLDLPDQESDLVALLTDIDRVSTAAVVGVIGGAGGAGASTFAAALAQACSRQGPTVLIDADFLGAGVDHVLGLDPAVGVRWDALLGASGRMSGRALRDALPSRDGLAVLAWPVERLPPADASGAREVIAAASRGFDTVVVDLPRGAQPVADELLRRCELLCVVGTATVPGLVAAARVVRRLPVPPSILVVRRRAGGVEPGEAGRFLGVDHVVAMTDQRGMDEDVALGAGPTRRSRGPLVRAARDVSALLAGSRR